tara:strand:- start:149 stop:580 length:432 start_codon:yes stop_codon:yes gene_type:complete
MDDIYLDHFLDAQNVDLEQVLAELSAGKKRSHWIWYIFPQIAPLGYSEKAKYYGIKTLNEAEAFISHPTLSANYLTCLDTLQLHTDQSISNILGGIDSRKFNSSLTLFKGASKNEFVLNKIQGSLERFFGGEECRVTLKFLSS